MQNLLEQISLCVERGKVDLQSPYPPDMKDQPGAYELTEQALSDGIGAQEILNQGFMVGMDRIGEKFSRGDAFIPDLMIAARAMTKSMELLKPYFDSGAATHKGTVILGTVAGDLHDIGKNIVKMVLEGAGWKTVDLGTNVTTEKFMSAITEHSGAAIGMSALLTTTMVNMEKSVREIKNCYPDTNIVIGGAPVTKEFCKKIGADAYFPDPHQFVKFLENNRP